MLCPKCGADTRVIETDKMVKAVIRVRKCTNENCKHHFETNEISTSALRLMRAMSGDTHGKGGAE